MDLRSNNAPSRPPDNNNEPPLIRFLRTRVPWGLETVRVPRRQYNHNNMQQCIYIHNIHNHNNHNHNHNLNHKHNE